MHRHTFRVASALVLCAVSAFVTGTAAAHISIDQGGTHKSRYGDGPDVIKNGPCGKTGGTRSDNVYTYAPGETVSVSLVEYIPHPSYFRIAFDNDGDDDFVPPASIDPIDPNRACPFNAADKCGAPDYYNNATVLPDMDDLNPHVSAPLGQKYTWDVQLPKVQCTNCTLQIIQVMEDTIHGAYNPMPGDPNDNPYVPDIYYQCIDLVLQGDVGESDAGTKPSKNVAEKSQPASSSGCTLARRTARNPSAAVFTALALALLAARRRR